MKTKQITIAVLMAATLLACRRPNNPTPPDEQNHSTKDSAQMFDTAHKNSISKATGENIFATKAAIGSMMEVESSANMIESTENPDVQTLATIMVKDHSMASKELQAIAKKENLKIPLALPQEKVDIMKKMDALKEEEKNLFYADLMVKEHVEAIALFATASAQEGNAALKSFAAKKLPILKHHLMEAQNVQKILKRIQPDKGDFPLKQSKDNKH
jgi:putative membrane protein